MSPFAKKKPDEDSAKVKELKEAKERIMKIKRDTIKLVEMMIEEGISKEWFSQNCGLLCRDDYQDVVEERSSESLCGYPLCDKQLGKVLKQKYHISTATNKVYDLTERKCFCSNECYKASNFIKAQLPQLPLYMRRKDNSVKIDIIQDSLNRGVVEIKFHHAISKDEIEPLDVEPRILSDHLPDMLHRDLKGCEELLSKLEITEKVYEGVGEEIKFHHAVSKDEIEPLDAELRILSGHLPDMLHRDLKGCEEQLSKLENTEKVYEETSMFGDTTSEQDQDESDDGELFYEYNTISSVSKLMPIKKYCKKTILLSSKLSILKNK